MHLNYYFSPLVVAFAIGLATPVKAAEPVDLQDASYLDIQKQFKIPSNVLLKSAPGATSNSNGVKLVGQHTDKKHVTHLRLQQLYAGFPVVGGYAIVHSSHGTSLKSVTPDDASMNGVLFQGLQKELGQPESSFVANGALVLSQFKSQYANEAVSEDVVTPIVYIDEHNKAHWAYKVSVLVVYEHETPQRPSAIIDAKTNQTLLQWNDMKTAKEAVKGVGFGGNRKAGKVKYGDDFPLLDITRDGATEMCFMENTEVKIVDMMQKYSSKNKAMTFACHANSANEVGAYLTGYDADGYDKINGSFSPSNDALYAGYVIKNMYAQWYNTEALRNSDGTPMQLVMRVHYGEEYGNAYWDGKQMTFGDGDDMMYPLVSLGVGAHEVSHGFTEQHSNLEYYGQSGGMNESFSDMAAQAAEYYSTGKNTWQIGAEIMKEDSGYDALRYMDKPSRDGRSIDDADEYSSGLDVHYSSGAYNHLFYLLSNYPDWNTRKAFDVMVKANMDYWTPYSDFDEGGCGILSAAKDLGYSLDDVQYVLNQIKIDTHSCKASN